MEWEGGGDQLSGCATDLLVHLVQAVLLVVGHRLSLSGIKAVLTPLTPQLAVEEEEGGQQKQEGGFVGSWLRRV